MRPLTESQIRSSFINCTKGEASRLNLPAGLGAWDWEAEVFLGWIDPKSPQRGYAVVPQEDGSLRGVVLTKATNRGRGAAQMCQFCLTLHSGSGVSLFSAARPSAKGGKGHYSSVGTYLCQDLRCTDYTLGRRRPEGVRQMEETMTVEDRRERTLANARGFIDRLTEEG